MTAKGVAPNRERLAQMLTEAGSALDPDGVAELIAGVLAAPPEIGTSWHALVADPTPPALAETSNNIAPVWPRTGATVSRRRISRGCRVRRGWRCCARNWRRAVSTGSSCRAPTSTRANMCRPLPNASRG